MTGNKFDLDPRFGKLIDGLLWWSLLIVAVLAVPAFAVIIISVLPMNDMVQIPVFILACWFAAWMLIRYIRRNKL